MKRIVMLAAACVIAVPAFAQNVATVNGKAIPQKSLDQFVKLLVSQGATDSPQLREQVKQEMINRQVFVQAAESGGIAKQADVQTEIELARQGILVRALMADYLAKKNSKDPGSAEKGGDLGWAPPTNYVQPFAQAVTQLKKGQLVDKPVQTQFGWHIIMVDDTRPVEFPPLDQVRPQLEEMLRQQTLADYQKELREKAKIQ